LFFEAIRVVRELQPKVVVLENVAALLTRGLDRVLGTLAEIGFDAEWNCIPAAAVGAPHIRDRVFVLAYANESVAGQERIQLRTGGDIEANKKRNVANTNSKRFSRRSQRNGSSEQTNTQRARMPIERYGGWTSEPGVCGMAYGVSNRVDRLRGLGNAVVPQVSFWIGERIVERLSNEDL
jgi:DNA (cytosine-5)-methyltransferase 1